MRRAKQKRCLAGEQREVHGFDANHIFNAEVERASSLC
jgi:hypothetical protein